MMSATVIDTPQGVRKFQAIAIKGGLKACKIGMRVNRAYTPANCMKMATQITGHKFKARDYDGTIAALEQFIAA